MSRPGALCDEREPENPLVSAELCPDSRWPPEIAGWRPIAAHPKRPLIVVGAGSRQVRRRHLPITCSAGRGGPLTWPSADSVFRGRERSVCDKPRHCNPHRLRAPPGYGLGAIRADHNVSSPACNAGREVVTTVSLSTRADGGRNELREIYRPPASGVVVTGLGRAAPEPVDIVVSRSDVDQRVGVNCPELVQERVVFTLEATEGLTDELTRPGGPSQRAHVLRRPTT